MATAAARFRYFFPKVSVVPVPGKRAAYSSSAGLRKGRNSPLVTASGTENE